MAATGNIFDIQRNSLNDGPGIRTTIFLKGCPLNCLWCHNEESIDTRPQLRYFPEKCTDCLECVSVCKPGAQLAVDGKHKLDFSACISNFDCVDVCIYGALTRTGSRMESSEVMEIVRRDIPYYRQSGGGITISGGEPMVQFEFTKELLKLAHEEGIHTCLDTSGQASENHYLEVLPLVDLFLFDFKESNPEYHEQFTGVENSRILKNLDLINGEGGAIILRCPIIPGLNDRPEHFREIARIGNEMKNIREVQLLPYHSMGAGKAEQHGRSPRQRDLKEPIEAEKEKWKLILEQNNLKDFVIF